MRVAISHETIYRFLTPSNHSIQYLRLTPISGLNQRVVSWKISAPGSIRPWIDGFGNAAHILVVDHPHEEIRITAIGEVEIVDSGKPLLGDLETHPPELYLRPSRLTELDERLCDFAAAFRPAMTGNTRKGLDGLLRGVRDTLTSKAADEPQGGWNTPTARQVLDARTGDGQDHAHLFIACCRSLGVPARYVSGYLCNDAASSDGMSSHAWAEAWIDGAGWLGYDAATPLSNAQARIRIAVGLDALDAAPVRRAKQFGPVIPVDIQVSVTDARSVQ